MMAPNKIIARAEQTIAEAGKGVQIAFVMRCGDQIIVRDNSGIEGLADDALLQKSLDLLRQLFPGKV